MARKKIAILAEGDVFLTWSWDESIEQHERWSAGFASNPVIMDISHAENVGVGWHWDGQNFIPPAPQDADPTSDLTV